MEVLSRAYFDQLVSADTAALLQRAAADAETEQEKEEVRELQRSYDEIGKIPAEEYAAFTKLTQESMPAWGKAKRGNDFASFAPYLEKIVESLRAQAHYFAPDRDPYEVWLDRYEHGLTIAQCDTFFAALRETIVPLLAAIKERGSAIRTDFLYQDWPIEQQRKLSKRSWKCGGWTRTTAYWAKRNTPLPPASGTAMCVLPPIICRRICSPTCTAWRTRAAMPCMS